MTTTNFIDGVTNVSEGATFGSFGALDPSKFWHFCDDFNAYNAAATLANWFPTIVGTTPTAIVSDAGKGVLLITNSALDNDGYAAQWSGGNAAGDVAGIFVHDATKQSWFKTRFAINTEVLQSDLVIGAYTVDATPVAGFADGFAFVKVDGSAALTFNTAIASVVSVTPVTTLVAGTFVDVGAYYNGAGLLEIFVNDARVASVVANNISPATLAPSFAFQNGEGVAKVMRLDYIMMAQAR